MAKATLRHKSTSRVGSTVIQSSQLISGLSNVDGFTTLIMVITFDHAAIGRQDHRRRPAGNDAYPAPVCTLMRRSSDLTGKLTTCLTVLAEQACFITAWTVSI
ncbi:Phosphoribosylamine--glycine ligase [Trichinella pseudospiralis]